MPRTQVFVSYSHADSASLARLRVHLRPFEREGRIDVWSDARLQPGQQWREEIREALSRAAAAILLVSADFLASDFIATDELPTLLEAARTDGVRILPVILKACAFADLPAISRFQAVNDPRQPIIGLNEAQQEDLWYRAALAARDAVVAAAQRIEIAAPEPAQVEPADQVLPYDDDRFDFSVMLESEIRTPRVVDDYFVYHYQHVDILGFMPEATRVVNWHPSAAAFLERLLARLRSEGWEGDGTLRAMWLPPFVGVGAEDTYGICCWFVKQTNNGEAWIASPVPLDFPRLQQQNEIRRIRF